MGCTYRAQKTITVVSGFCYYAFEATRGNHVCLPQVSGQKRKPQIDGTYKVKNLHI